MSRNTDFQAPSRNPTRTCFIGNLPWDITEPQLKEVFAEIGPIKFFRLVTDRDTGKPKGFGFCEYYDTATAAAAQRNLNNHELSGRNIHVDFAEDKEHKERFPREGTGGRGSGRGMPPHAGQMQAQRPLDARMPQPIGGLAAGQAEAAMGVLVDGPSAAATAPSDHSVTAVLAGMTRRQLYDILSQMKALLQQNPVQARQIMVNNPQLTKALFQAQITLGMVPLPEDLHMPQLQQQQQQQQPPLQQQPMQQQPLQQQPLQQQPLQQQQPLGNGVFVGGGGAQQPQLFNPGANPHQTPPYGGGSDPSFAQQLQQQQQQQQLRQQQQQQQPPQQPFAFDGGGGGALQSSLPQQVQGGFIKQDLPQYGTSPYGQHGMQSNSSDPSLRQGQGQLPFGQERALGGGGGVPGQPGDPRSAGFSGPQYSPSQQQQPQQQQQQQQPPQQQPQQQAGGSENAQPSGLEDQQKALLEQVMSLTQQQIDLLPPQQKAQVLALQQHSRALGSRP